MIGAGVLVVQHSDGRKNFLVLVVLVCLWCGIPPSDGRASPVQRNQATPELHPESQTTLGSELNSSAGGFAWAQNSGFER